MSDPQLKLAAELFKAALQGDLHQLELLLANKGAAQAIDRPSAPYEATPLHGAIVGRSEAAAELLLCRGADVQLCWHAPSAFHKPETVAFLKLIYEDGAVVSWQGDHIVVISPIRIACLMLNSSMVKLLASRQQMRSSPGYMHSLHSGQMLDPASVPLVLWVTAFIISNDRLEAQKRLMKTLHEIEPQQPRLYMIVVMQLALAGLPDLAMFLMHKPFYPPLNDSNFHVSDLTNMLLNTNTGDLSKKALSALFKFLHTVFVKQGAETLWQRVLHDTDAQGSSLVHASVERGDPDLCSVVARVGASIWVPYSTGPRAGMTAPELAAVRGHAAVLLTLLRDGAAREESLTAANSYKLVSALFCSPAALGLSDLIDVLSVGMGRGIQLHLCFARRQGRSPLALACANGYLAGAQAVTLPICKNAALRAVNIFRHDHPFLKGEYSDPEKLYEDIGRIAMASAALVPAMLRGNPEAHRKGQIATVIGKESEGWCQLWRHHGSLLHAGDEEGLTPLMLAVQAGSLEVVKYLLQLAGSEQADMLLAADNAGKLAAHHALCMEQQGLSTFAELMDVSQRIGVLGRMLAHATQDGTNLAFALVNFAQAVRFKHGTDPAFQSPCNMVAAMMRTSFAPMFCVPNRLGASPLSVAVKADWTEAIQQMLSMCNLREAGVSIDTADGMTPLGWTVVNDRKQTALQLVKAFRSEGFSDVHALIGTRRMFPGIKQPLFLAILRQSGALQWAHDSLDTSHDDLQVIYIQVTGMGEPTGKVLQCSPDAPVLQQNRADFEALTLLMFAAACGNTAETERLLAQGAPSQQDRLTAGNKWYASALTMAVQYAGIATRDGKLHATGVGKLDVAHFCCIWQLLRAKYSLRPADRTKLEQELCASMHTLMQHKEGVKLKRAFAADKIQACALCKQHGLWARCKCELVFYCSTACQRTDWSRHRAACKCNIDECL